MNRVAEIKKQFAKIEWYKQGAAVRPLYIGYPWQGCTGFTLHGKPIPLSYLPFGIYVQADLMDVYFSRSRLREVGLFYYKKEKQQPGFMEKAKQRWERKEVVQLAAGIKKIYHTNFQALSNSEIARLFIEFSKLYSQFWKEAIFLDAFDVMSEIILEEAMRKERRTLNEAELHILTSVEKLSWLQQEQQELIACAALPFLKQEQALRRHAARWHWIYNDYAVVHELDWKFFKKRMQDFLRSRRAFREEKYALDAVKFIARKKKRLARKLKLSRGFINTVNFIIVLSEWRDSRKAFNQMVNGALYQFVKELQRRTNFTKDEIEYLWPDEVLHIFKMNRHDMVIAHKRKKGFFSIGSPAKKAASFLGRDARGLQKFMLSLLGTHQQLKGRPAYAGIVRGSAKIILEQKDFSKMKRGDILVAPNTRPEYMPIMKIAGAIISEEGGLTCHAAIVSRELKIPAIVGVQGAIVSLKDGDRVEVDAEKGVVKKL